MRVWMAAAAAAVALGGAAQAATVTFEGGTFTSPDGDPFGTYVEAGVTVTPESEFSQNGGHIDDGGTGYASSLTFTMAGSFDATSVDFTFASSAATSCRDDEEGTQTCVPLDYAYIRVTGYQGGTLVASTVLGSEAEGTTYAFDSAFSGLDSLVFSFAPLPGVPAGSYYECLDNPCSHYTIDNVVLAPAAVPLPASATLLAAGLGGLALLRRRRSRA